MCGVWSRCVGMNGGGRECGWVWVGGTTTNEPLEKSSGSDSAKSSFFSAFFRRDSSKSRAGTQDVDHPDDSRFLWRILAQVAGFGVGGEG
jgi:hypothetical protein